MGCPPPAPGAMATTLLDASTASMAERKSAQPQTSSTDVNRPAMELLLPSSAVDDDRTTSDSSPAWETSDQADRSSSPSGRVAAVVTTMPGRTGRPARAAAARAAALAPASSGISARGSSRASTFGSAASCRPVTPSTELTLHPLELPDLHNYRSFGFIPNCFPAIS